MVDKRIFDYPDTTANDPKYVFTIDRVNNATGKITYVNMGKQLTTDIEKARTWIFSKVDDDTFALNSILGNEQNQSFSLVDGQIFKISPINANVTFAWQPNPNPKIKINSADAIDVYNGIYYDEYGFTGLDRNTFWDKGMYFYYDATLNALLVYKIQYNSGDVLYRYTEPDRIAGVYEFEGMIPDPDTYPVFTQVLAQEGNGAEMVDMANTCFCGRDSRYTPHGVITEGSLWRGIDLSVDFSGYFYAMVIYSSGGSGLFNYSTSYDKIKLYYDYHVSSTTEVYYGTLKNDAMSSITLTIPNGTNTLTKRRGVNIGRVL